jgi:import inner membrane translocase subunit TIM44
MKYHNEVLDISNLEVVGGKIMDQGPVLIISFTAQQILYVTNSEGKVIEGDKDRIKRVNHIWVLLRDQSLFDPNSAW